MISDAHLIYSDFGKKVLQDMGETPTSHRKQWEYVAVVKMLEEFGKIFTGSKGIVFGVGQEPVVAYLAARGCSIVATDLGSGAWWGNWKEVLNDRNLCKKEDFEERVQVRDVDMNWIPDDLREEEFDFAWSCCSLDHVGSILLGQRFICKQMECLSPGGVSVHTGEYNLTSTWDTIDYAPTVAWTRYDICMLISFLESYGNNCHFDWQFDQDAAYPRLKDMGVSLRGDLDLTSFALPVVKGQGPKVIWSD